MDDRMDGWKGERMNGRMNGWTLWIVDGGTMWVHLSHCGFIFVFCGLTSAGQKMLSNSQNTTATGWRTVNPAARIHLYKTIQAILGCLYKFSYRKGSSNAPAGFKAMHVVPVYDKWKSQVPANLVAPYQLRFSPSSFESFQIVNDHKESIV